MMIPSFSGLEFLSTGPLSGVLHVEEFTVELLGEETLTGFSFSLLHRKVGSLRKGCSYVIPNCY